MKHRSLNSLKPQRLSDRDGAVSLVRSDLDEHKDDRGKGQTSEVGSARLNRSPQGGARVDEEGQGEEDVHDTHPQVLRAREEPPGLGRFDRGELGGAERIDRPDAAETEVNDRRQHRGTDDGERGGVLGRSHQGERYRKRPQLI